jgi:hypothetical protein
MIPDLRPMTKTAILLSALPPESAESLLQELRKDEAEAVRLEMSRLPSISPQERDDVAKEFFSHFGVTQEAHCAGAPGPSPSQEHSGSKEIECLEALKADGTANLSAAQKIAIVLVSIPAEASDQILKELGPREKHLICSEISRLPMLPPELISEVIEEFKEASGGLPGGSGGTSTDVEGHKVKELVAGFRAPEDDKIIKKFRRRLKFLRIVAWIIPVACALIIALYLHVTGKSVGRLEILFFMTAGSLFLIVLLFLLVASQMALLKNTSPSYVMKKEKPVISGSVINDVEARLKEDPGKMAELLRKTWLRKD